MAKKNFFLFFGKVAFHYIHTHTHTHTPHSFFIHSSVEGHFSCFHILAIVNNVAIHIGVPVSFQISVSVYFGHIPRVELLNHVAVLFMGFWGPSILFSTVAVPIYIPTTSVEDSLSPHFCQCLLIVFFLISSQCDRYGWYLMVILICISLMISDVGG